MAEARPKLKDVFEVLVNVSAKWKFIGLQLGVGEDKMANIQSATPKDCLLEVLSEYLDSPAPSWGEVAKALRSRSVGEVRLAARIEENYYSSQTFTVKKAEYHGEATPLKADMSRLSIDEDSSGLKQKPAQLKQTTEGHPWAKPSPQTADTCTRTYTEPMKPKRPHLVPIQMPCSSSETSSDSVSMERNCSLPYLKTPHLSDEARKNFIGRLLQKTEDMELLFAEMMFKARKSLEARGVPLEDLIAFLTPIKSATVQSRDSDCKSWRIELTKATNLLEVFTVLEPFVSFFNHEIIEHIIKCCGSIDDQRRLANYKQKFTEFCKLSVCECPADIYRAFAYTQFAKLSEFLLVVWHQDLIAFLTPIKSAIKTDKDGTVTVKLNDDFQQYTVEAMNKFRHKLCNILDVSEYDLRLIHVHEGCTEINFAVFLDLLNLVFPLSEEQKAKLNDEGVILMTRKSGQHKCKIVEMDSEWQMSNVAMVSVPRPVSVPVKIPTSAHTQERTRHFSHGATPPDRSTYRSSSPGASPAQSPGASPLHSPAASSSPYQQASPLHSPCHSATRSPSQSSSPTQKRFNPSGTEPIQLWQFLLELLMDRDCQDCIAWTGREWEFKFIDPEEVAKRWGSRRNKPKMNYEKLSRFLRYYHARNIMKKIPGKRYVYRFVCDLESMLGMSFSEVQLQLKGEELAKPMETGSTKWSAIPSISSTASTLCNDDTDIVDIVNELKKDIPLHLIDLPESVEIDTPTNKPSNEMSTSPVNPFPTPPCSSQQQTTHSATPASTELEITIVYGSIAVYSERVECSSKPCRIFSNSRLPYKYFDDEKSIELFGSCEPHTIELPESHPNAMSDEIFSAMRRGIVIEQHDGNIYVTPLCRTVVYYAGSTSERSVPLDRNQRTKVFDYSNYFRPALEHYAFIHNNPPSPNVILGLGQCWSIGRDITNNLISVVITHVQAKQEMSQIDLPHVLAPDLLIDLPESVTIDTPTDKPSNEMSTSPVNPFPTPSCSSQQRATPSASDLKDLKVDDFISPV